LSTENNRAEIIPAIQPVTTIRQIVRVIRALGMRYKPVAFGVDKRQGVSIDRERKNANEAALMLLNSLQDGDKLTDEQRKTLAGYTGEGGIGGSEYEYYTPQPVAEGIWDLLAAYGVAGGIGLEPAAGTGVFQETKPTGVIMQSAEISDTSGRINRLLHPEDNVNIGAFESLASSTPDNTFDHCVGNVPFGQSRGKFAELDTVYKDESLAGYFVLRPIDKVRYGGLICLIVPNGLTHNTSEAKLREKVSRKAEFLGAHRLPSGTFENSGTATVVDVWVLRKHSQEMTERIMQEKENVLREANVLWDTFIKGKWFDLDGRRYIHGEMSKVGKDKFSRLVVKANGMVDGAAIKIALAKKFDSRINWELLSLDEPQSATANEGEKRLFSGVWYEFVGGRWLVDDSANYDTIDMSKYGGKSYSDLVTRLNNAEGLLSLTPSQLEAVWQDFPDAIPKEFHFAISFSMRQKPALRERVLRGSLIGARIKTLQEKMATGWQSEALDRELADVQRLVGEEVTAHGNPHQGRSAKVAGDGAAGWLTFKASVTKEGELSALLRGDLDKGNLKTYDATDHEQVLRHLFNQIDLDPVELNSFREAFTGDLPASDTALLNLLATKDGIAVQPDGTLMPMDRATSGDIGLLNSQLLGALDGTPDGAIKDNYHRQLAEIKARRKWTNADDIDFSLNSRWFDRSVIQEFLQERGYSDVKYVKNVQIENGDLVSEDGYHGGDGIFTGYRYKSVRTKNKETGKEEWVYKRVRNSDGFLDQFENYLNGVKPRGVNADLYLEQIRGLEDDFNQWIRRHDSLSALVQQYNDSFNAFIPYSHSEESLNLSGISGDRIPFRYQNSEVRRLSEDGRGITAFGTGLGKSTVGLALEAYNFENGRSKRTAFVVPKAVLENWYHEAQEFYSKSALDNMLFVGLDEIRGEDGFIKQIPVLDDNGEPVINSKTGLQVYRNAVKLASPETIKERMNMIPMSNYRSVLLTKEQFAAIPLRQDTVDEHARDVLFAEAQMGRVDLIGGKHRDAAKRNKILARASDTGTDKKEDFPYFEDMHFDSIIVDEGHNYRNSYAAGREAAQLAYLPTGAVAKTARDMALKTAFTTSKNSGRGPVFLTATPLVNSPIDAFNMLSHVVSSEEWQRMGILTPDDFVKTFGLTEEVTVQKISGEIERKQGLVGFKNLDGLRGIFHRWTTLKTAKDVSDTVRIPELDERNVPVPMTAKQAEIYEELRQRADALSKGEKPDEGEESDSIFSIIRDMDRVCIDPDLYYRQMTFRFPVGKASAVAALVDLLPEYVGRKLDEDDDSGKSVRIKVAPEVTTTSDYVQLVVSEAAESEVLKRLGKAGLQVSDVSHPVPPKYSALIENLKEGVKTGKQIIFTDEKTQHGKLARIIADALGIDLSMIGILNATTVAEAGKTGRAPKAVAEPKEPKEDASQEELANYYQAKEEYDEYIAKKTEVSLGGLEQIAANYNEGRTPFLICNKKAEVGINLHRGTSDVHHLTLPWTPASIDQRNGRGARVGSKASSVRVHYYCGKGSFDEFRLNTLKRKKDWITEILTSDKARMANADANNQEEMRLLLAANPEDHARMVAEARSKAEAVAREKARQRAEANLAEYLKMSHAEKESATTIASQLAGARSRQEEAERKLAAARDDVQKGMSSQYSGVERHARDWVSAIQKSLQKETREVTRLERITLRMQKAADRIKQLSPEIERAIKAGLLNIDTDILTHGDRYVQTASGRMIKRGGIYRLKPGSGSYVRLRSIDIDIGSGLADVIFFEDNKGGSLESGKTVVLADLGEDSDVPESEATLRAWAAPGRYTHSVEEQMTKGEFERYLANGWLILSDTRVVYRNDAGELDTYDLRITRSYSPNPLITSEGMEWLTQNAANVVYPDTQDDTLKTAMAKWCRSDRNVRGIEPFLIGLFGREWRSEVNKYGEIASPAAIDEIVAAYVARSIEKTDLKNRKFDGSQVSQYSEYLLTGKYDATQYISNVIPPFKASYIPSEYRNTEDFQPVLSAATKQKAAEHHENVVQQAKRIAHAAWLRYGDNLALPVSVVYEKAKEFRATALLLSPMYKSSSFGVINYDAYNLDEFYAHAVIMGLIDKESITESAFYDSSMIGETTKRIDSAFSAANSDNTAFLAGLKLRAGLITEEEAKAEVDRVEAEKTQRVKADEAVSEATTSMDSITVRKNTQPLTGGKGTNRYDFPADGAYGLQDSDGIGGALYQAKDKLKSEFGAKYLNGKRSGMEFMGSWWIIPATHDLKDVMAVIAEYS
jgi:hypothetical protein